VEQVEKWSKWRSGASGEVEQVEILELSGASGASGEQKKTRFTAGFFGLVAFHFFTKPSFIFFSTVFLTSLDDPSISTCSENQSFKFCFFCSFVFGFAILFSVIY